MLSEISQISSSHLYMEAENKLKNKNKFTDTDQVDKKKLVKMTKRYKIPVISKSWGCKV